MTTAPTGPAGTPFTGTRRPRDRRQQILAAAAAQFRQRGYHGTGIADLADAVGVRSSAALYRHFPTKQDILRATLEDAAEQMAGAWADEDRDLDTLLATAAERSLQRRDAIALWATQLDHLPRDERRELIARFTAALPPLKTAVARTRPDLADDDVDLLAWAVASVNLSIGYHAGGLDGARLRRVLVGAGQAVCANVALTRDEDPAGVVPVASAATPAARLLPSTRREAVIVAATRLFTARGYDVVSMDDIGAAVGTTGAAVYHHFDNRAAILAAVLRRCYESLFFELSHALNRHADPARAFHDVIEQFVRISIAAGPDIRAAQRHLADLPDDDRADIRALQVGYVAEWAGLLRQVRPDLPRDESVALTHVAFWTVATLLTIGHLRERATLADDLQAVCRAILGLPGGAAWRGFES